MSAKQKNRPGKSGQDIPTHPDYPDELNQDQIDAIRKLADPNGELAAKRVLLYPSLT